MRQRFTAAFVLVALVATTASAASGDGQFRATGALELSDLESLRLVDAYLTVYGDAPSLGFELDAASLRVERTWAEGPIVHNEANVPGSPVHVGTVDLTRDAETETLVFDGAKATLFSAEASPSVGVALVAWGGELAVLEPERAVAGVAEPGRADPFFGVYTDDVFWARPIAVEAAHFDVADASGAYAMTGDFQIYLFNVAYVVETLDDERLFETGYPQETTPRGKVEVNILHVTDGALRVTADAATLRAPQLVAGLDGRLGLDEATGYFDAGDARYEARRLPAVLEGRFTVQGQVVSTEGDPAAFLTLTGDLRKASLAPGDRPRGILPTPETAGKAAAWAGGTLAAVAGSVLLVRRGRDRFVAGFTEDPVQCVEHALVASGAGRHKEALRWYRRARELAPRDPLLALDEGIAREAAYGRPAAGRAAYEEALRLDPELAEAHLRYARVLAADGMKPAALSHLGRALALEPGLASAAAEDDAFAPWRDDPRFASLLGYYRAA